MREDGAKILAGLAVGGHGDDLGGRMLDQQPHQLGASIAAGADDGDADAIG